MKEVKAEQYEKNGNFLVYRSSAGSGKTFTLVLEYLKLALGEHENGYTEDYYKHILAVTFTNKAANEMKERVLLALKAIENNYSSLTSRDLTLADLLCKHLCIEYDVLQYRAKKCFAHMLHNYPLLGISTIDSFISRVVRTFSRDLKLNEGFKLSLNADDLANRAIRQLYRSVDKHNPEVASLVIEYVLQRLDDHQKPDWKSLLLAISGEMFKEKSSEYIKRITALEPKDFEDFKSILKAQIVEYRSQELALALACEKLVVDAGLTLTDLKSKSRGVGGWLEKVIIGKVEIKDKFQQDKCLQEELYAMGYSADIKNRIMVFSEDFKQRLGLLFEHQNKGYNLSVFSQSLLKNINFVALLNHLKQAYAVIQREDNMVHLSEFNENVARVVKEQPLPFIYERLGNRYRHYLLDEFQDTSVTQFNNLLPLIDNALSEGNFCMVVGDSKQSIYKFRGAKVELFHGLPHVDHEGMGENFVQRLQSLKAEYNDKELAQNFRSKMEIVSFNNKFFRLAVNYYYKSVADFYSKLEQEYNPNNTGGLVQFYNVPDDKDVSSIHVVLGVIAQCLQQGRRYRDIGVLARKNSEIDIICKALAKAGIPVINDDSLYLRNSSSVQLLLNVFNLVSGREDLVARAAVLFHLKAYRGLEVKHSQIGTLANGKYAVFEAFLVENGFSFSLDYMRSLSPYRLYEHLLLLFGFNALSDEFVVSFGNVIFDYFNDGGLDLYNFLNHWDENAKDYAIQPPEDMDAVTVMTVHKSKGLQFPVVIFQVKESPSKAVPDWLDLPNVYDDTKLDVGYINWKAEFEQLFPPVYIESRNSSRELDILNLFYVGFTRPEEQLHVVLVNTSDSVLAKCIKDFDFNNVGFEDVVCTDSKLNALNVVGLSMLSSGNINKSMLHTSSLAALDLRRLNRFNELLLTNRVVYARVIVAALPFIKTTNDIKPALNRLVDMGELHIKDMDNAFLEVQKFVFNPLISSFFAVNGSIACNVILDNFVLDRVLVSGEKVFTLRVVIADMDENVLQANARVVDDYYYGKGYREVVHAVGCAVSGRVKLVLT